LEQQGSVVGIKSCAVEIRVVDYIQAHPPQASSESPRTRPAAQNGPGRREPSAAFSQSISAVLTRVIL